ncbi:hypothetical protein M513_10145 [Trichuris suis]|uniref:Optic atrophy 3 protein n=1 Tax=Trichuris suis TaxID=68888 RepID=A0A085LVJ7_9BILA|nr:hypothetical protein M513_10145 [Trichuris suis]
MERNAATHFADTFACQLLNVSSSLLYFMPIQLALLSVYHRVDVTKKMLMMGFGKPAKVPSLTEESAVELGADILGEVIVYSIAATLFTLEYMRPPFCFNRTSEKARVKEELLLNRISNLEDKISELALSAERNEAVLRSMERLVKEKSSSLSWWKGGKPSSASENDQKEGTRNRITIERGGRILPVVR